MVISENSCERLNEPVDRAESTIENPQLLKSNIDRITEIILQCNQQNYNTMRDMPIINRNLIANSIYMEQMARVQDHI